MTTIVRTAFVLLFLGLPLAACSNGTSDRMSGGTAGDTAIFNHTDGSGY